MKLLVDMLACQTYSRFRGIGRYTLSLTLEMAKQRGLNEMIALADPLYTETFEELRQEFVQLLPAGAVLPYYHNSLENAPWLTADPYSIVAESLIEQAYQVVAPDVVLTPSLFEGWGGGTYGKVPLPDKKFPNQKRAVILYDIIPYIFQKQYLDSDPLLKKWYLERIEMLQHYDLLLAISEATRQDAINVLGISPDKVVNISGAASAIFKKIDISENQRQQYLQRFGISRPFILYIGGADFRKNMDGTLRIFAQLPREITSSHQLVLNDVGDETTFRTKARKLGLDDSDLVIIRRVTDEEIVALYNLTKLSIFPSLYEGFGLPVLEAMSCGAPVLASNNSSLPEVVGNTDALFNAADEPAAAASILKVLTDEDFRLDLGQFGLEQSKNFSWARSAERAWNAIEDLGELDSHKKFSITPNKKTSMKIAYVSPLPPQKSGIAEYSAALLPYLAEFFEIDLLTTPGLQVSNGYLENQFSMFPWDELKKRYDDYDAIVYQMGNSEFHIPMLDLLKEMPGIVVSHDFYNGNLPFVKEIKMGDRGVFYNAIDHSHGLRGLIDYLKQGIESARWTWPINWPVLKGAQELIIHSEHQNELIRRFFGFGWQPKPKIIKQLRASVPTISQSKKNKLRKELGLDESTFIYCSFGFMAPTKLNNLTIKAFAQALEHVDKNAELVFVGDLEGGEYGLETLNIIEKLKLKKRVRITGYVSKEDYEKYLACADVAIQLRAASRGETSRAVLDCMAFGLPTIVNAHGSFNDYRSSDIVKLPESPSLDDITNAMIRLQTDEKYRIDKGQRAKQYIKEHHDPEKIAAAYADVIQQVIQTKDQKIFAPLIDAIFDLESPPDFLELSAEYAAKNASLRCQPRILIDVTNFNHEDLSAQDKEGASQIIKEMLATDNPSVRIELVTFSNDQILRAGREAEELCQLPKNSISSEKSIAVQPGDVLVMLEQLLFTSVYSPKISEIIRQKSGKIITFVQNASKNSLNDLTAKSDMFLCESRKVAEKFAKHIEVSKAIPTHHQNIFYIYSDENISHSWERSIVWLLDPLNSEHVSNLLNDPIAQSKMTADSKTEIESTLEPTLPIVEQNFSTAILGSEKETHEGLLKSSACSQEILESDVFQAWVERIKGQKLWMHRKLWEWAYISQALHERELLKPGMRGLGFAVGQEPLPSLFASYGCEIVATDLATEAAREKGWVDTNQHAEELKELNIAQICPDALFEQLVSFRFVDMNHIDEDLQGFDFVWSSCSLEHLGSLEHGKQFVYNAMKCLKPGGFAVHTTEYNISSNEDTIEEGDSVIYRKKDMEEIARTLHADGHSIELDFTLGQKPLDLHVDLPPYKQDVHLRLELGGFTSTSYGLIIQKKLE